MTELSGRRNKACYYVLCLAVETACGCLPEEPAMKAVCAAVGRRTGMSSPAADIWDFGNRDKLREIYGRPVLERPTPKELVWVLAYYCWPGEDSPSQPPLRRSASF